jgi:hypothetical protein
MRSGLRTFVGMTAIIVGAAALSFAWGEKIPRNAGFGFEAFSVYKPIAERFPEYIGERRIDSYSIQRIFPFALAHYALRAVGLPPKGPLILRFFEVYNAAILVLMVGLWLASARREGISTAGQWLGFLSLIVNFAIFKLNFYYPASYNQTALVVAMGALFFYLRGELVGLLAVSLIGLVVWPTTIVFHSVLLLFPRTRRIPERPGPPGRATVWLIRAAAAGLLYLFFWIYFVEEQRPNGVADVVMPLLPVSFAAVWVYLTRGLTTLAEGVDLGRRQPWGGLLPSRTGLASVGVLLAAYLLLTRVLASDARPRFGADRFLANVAFGATTRPLQFLIAHVVYFGPTALLLLVLWRPVSRRLRGLGTGLTLVCALGVFQGVNCESRQLINLWPFFVLPAVQALEELRLPAGFYWTVAAFATLLSKAWLRINYGLASLGEAARTFPNTRDFLDFPDQVWFMNFGPWMSNLTLLVHALVVGGMGLWLKRRYLTAASGPPTRTAE